MFNSPTSPPRRQIITSTTSVRDVATSPLSLQKQNFFACVEAEGSDFVTPCPLKNNKKTKLSSIGFLERSRSQMLTISTSSLIQKIFGGTPKKKQKQLRNNKNSPLINEQRKQLLATPTSLQNGEAAHFRKPRWPLTPLRSFNSTSTCSPTPKLQQQQTPPYTPTNNNYFTSSKPQQVFQLPPKKEASCYNLNFPSISSGNFFETNLPLKQQNWGYNNRYNNTNNIYPNNYYHQIPIYNERHSREGNSELVYDERLKEWIYPLGECMRDELERLAYFCRPNEKDYVINQLCLMPPGHFMLRLSGSRRRCLALTMRVPEPIDGTITRKRGIANYLIIRNVHGFRIRGSKRYFQSLPMLITHHSVLPEQLPCRLQLSDWRWTREPKTNTLLRRQSSGGSTAIAMRCRDEEGRQSPSDTSNMVRWRRPLASQNEGCVGGNIHLTGKDQKLSINAFTRTNSINTMFSSKSSTLLSA
uniref:SH2 domain-containing protein n=1 Tax=Meloidogyne incognita TaxID=6306 RepID=A0A914LKZ2_MELIC